VGAHTVSDDELEEVPVQPLAPISRDIGRPGFALLALSLWQWLALAALGALVALGARSWLQMRAEPAAEPAAAVATRAPGTSVIGECLPRLPLHSGLPF
jgi:hypothetical protein